MTDEAPHTPTSAVASSNGFANSPQSRRQSLQSPWASVVRGDSEQVSSPTASVSPPPEQGLAQDNSVMESPGPEAQPDSSDVNGDGNDRPRRPAWSRPLNGIVEAGPVMGAISWPALSESTRPVPRSGPDSTRPVLDGSASSSQAPIMSQPPQRPANTNAHVHPHANNTMPNRPRSRNRNGGGGSSSGNRPSQSNFNRPTAPAPPPFPVFEVPYGMIPPMVDTPVRSPIPVGEPGGSQSHTGNDHPSQRNNNSRRGNYGPRPRGDGPYHNNHGGRRDQDRRDVPLPPKYVPPFMGYIPSPLLPGAAPFMALPPMRVFPGQMGFEMPHPFFYVPPSESFRSMPMVPPLPPMFVPPANETPLTSMIVKQIDYYFSDDNLVKDSYLRSNMDDHGWVSIVLIASFPRVQNLTKEIPVILGALQHSTIVEVEGERIRRCNDWNRWLRGSSVINNGSSSNGPAITPDDALVTSFNGVSLDNSLAANGQMEEDRQDHTEMASGELTGQSRLANGEDNAEEDHLSTV